jgi:hypothetical protein
VFARFGVDFDRENALARGSAAVEGLVGDLRGLGSAVAGAALVAGIRNFAAETSELGAQTARTARALGLAPQEFQAWRAGAVAAGATAEQFQASMGSLQRQIYAAATGSQDAAANFRRLGVRVRGEGRTIRSTTDILADLADGIAAQQDPTRRAALAMRIFGESGARLLPLLERGSAGVGELEERFRELGGGMSDEALQASEELQAAYSDLDLVLLGFRSRIAVYVLPVVRGFTEITTESGAALSAMADRGRIAEVALGALALTATAAAARTLVAWTATAAPFVGLALVVGAALLVVEDLVVAFEGGDSAIAHLADTVEAWATSAPAELEPVIAAWRTFQSLVMGVFQTVHDLTGLGPDLSGGDGDLALDPTDRSARGRVTDALVRERRAALGDAQTSLAPDGLERYLAERDASRLFESGDSARVGDLLARFGNQRGIGGPPQVTEVRIDRIDANGLQASEVQGVVRDAVRTALDRRDAEAEDTLAQ